MQEEQVCRQITATRSRSRGRSSARRGATSVTRTLTRLWLGLGALGVILFAIAAPAWAQKAGDKPPDESLLGEFLIVGTEGDQRPQLAILPSLSPDLEDVIVRGVVRRDFELSGLYRMIPDKKAPPGMYGFEDPVDVGAWQNIGAQVVVKVAARRSEGGKIQVFGLAYLPSAGKEPVFREIVTVQQEDVRVTAHRVTDALLEALTGRRGGFASHMAFSSRWTKHHAIFKVDADGHNLTRVSNAEYTGIAPVWGKNGLLVFSESINYSPYKLAALPPATPPKVSFAQSIYAATFNADFTKLALSVDTKDGSAIYVGNADGSNLKKVSTTEVAVSPAFSPSGKLAWVGGAADHGMRRIYIDGKVVSPSGFSAASPTFCDTEDGIRLVYSVGIGGGRSDLVWSSESGKGIARLTQNAGSNTSPACSPDGRLLAFFSERKQNAGLYVKSLKSFTTHKISGRLGHGLNWAALPPPPQ